MIRFSAFVLAAVVTTAAPAHAQYDSTRTVQQAATPDDGSRDDGTRVVARINEDSVTVDRFNATYVQRLINTGRNDTPEERYAHLHELIDTYLLAEAARDRGLEDAAYQEYIDMEIRKIVGGRYFEVAFADSLPDPTEEDVRIAYRRENEQVALRHLFFRHPDSARAAYERLEEGADFLRLANEVFESAEFDSLAGFLGAAEYWDLDDAVAEAAWSLNVGEYSEPVRSRYGWHILRLEDRLRNPLLTEDEFNRRRDDLSYRVRARRFRMQGTEFVRSFMNSLAVEVSLEGMNQLHEAVVLSIEPDDDPQAPRVTLDEEEIEAVRDDFSPDTPLLTYSFGGERRTFTAGQYFEWMGHLPASEIRNRVAASVGRALRNQVLAEAALDRGLQDDPLVRDEVEYRASTYLSDALRDRLREESDQVDISEAELREAFERLRLRKLKTAEADYWHLTFDNVADAEAAKDAIVAGETEPSSYASYSAHDDADLRPMGELGTYIRRAPLETPLVMGTGDGGWHVVEIADRTVEYTTFQETRDQVEQRFRPFVPEMRLLRELRQEADVEIDSELFEEMMRLGRDAPSDT